MFSLRPVLKSLALLVFIVPSLSVFAQQEEVGDDSSLMTNYNAMREEGQGFYLGEIPLLYEQPGSVLASFVTLNWWCDLEFSSGRDDGYVGRGVAYFLGSSLEDLVAQGAEASPRASKNFTLSVSAVMVPTLGIFEGQWHTTYDDLVFRYWDDGSSTLPVLGWEGHDAGDTHPNAFTSAWSGSGTITKITTEAAAELLGMDVADMTPATCSMEYEAAWNDTNVPDPIDPSLTTLEENNAQLQADNKELMSRIAAIEESDNEELMSRLAAIEEIMSRIAAIEESLTANGSGSDGDGVDATSTSSSPFMKWFEYDTTDNVMKSIMTVAVIIGLVAVDFI